MKYLAKTSILLYIFFYAFSVSGQTMIQTEDSISRKKINVLRITEPPKIDGILDDAAWKNAPIADGFVERIPVNGRPIPDSLKTEVKIVYDDLGIYFGATLNDPDPNKILKELTERDQIGNDDFFFILLNGYNDRQQSLQFIVTAAGVQYDAKMTNDNEDSSWNAVWYSAVNINENGWVAEIFIPYSELRFPSRDVQTWGLNMEREFRRERTRYSWNHIDNTKGSFSIYDGEIHGIENIETPLRLSLQPYLSAYVNNFDGETETVVNGGADLKYGINDAFTLDMVLVPDFGQTKFDETVLNLSAFEVQYAEQRPFFTEGTELFSKGNLFYSRRIGGAPSGSVTLTENEEIVSFPSRVDLLNASKISGRTSGGLGIGFFNAITKKAEAAIVDSETQEQRKVVVEPLTNYNILVLDQRFGENSSLSFVNTNVLRDGGFTDANASALLLSLTNKKNTYRYNAGAKGSWVVSESTKFGMEGQAQISNISGKHRTTAAVFFRTKDYDINDLGFSANTNFINYYGYYGYRLLQPVGFLNSMNLNFNLNYDRRLEPDLYHRYSFNFNSNFTTKDFFGFGGGFESTPFGVNDIYEPRIEGRHVKVPAYYNPWVWISTDYRKRFALDVNLDWVSYDQKDRESFFIQVSPRFRFSDKWKMAARSSINKSFLEEGFVNIRDNDIIFGQRGRNTIVNSIESQYIFNNKMALDLSFRHYYSEVAYRKFYTLEDNGGLAHNTDYSNVHDTTFNAWNVDLRYSWWFAPGSQVTFLYRNAIDSFINQSGLPYSENFTDLFDSPQLNSFSIRISYFLDYNRMKNMFQQNNDGSQVGRSLPLKMNMASG
tara:strand:- start:52732 stop:55224 length:2493 start_codon:yes stop_codon:yes gene_type:complete